MKKDPFGSARFRLKAGLRTFRFWVLGIGAAVGRTFTVDDDRPGSLPVAVISFGYWKRRFAQDPAAIDKVILLGKVPVNVVGVTPPGFSGLTVAGKPADVFLPMSLRSQLALKDLDRFAIGRAGRRRLIQWTRSGASEPDGLSN